MVKLGDPVLRPFLQGEHFSRPPCEARFEQSGRCFDAQDVVLVWDSDAPMAVSICCCADVVQAGPLGLA
eukprot:50184-Eustigmatos_ZCMA.PRE.1